MGFNSGFKGLIKEFSILRLMETEVVIINTV
jgi:hypothetical protein